MFVRVAAEPRYALTGESTADVVAGNVQETLLLIESLRDDLFAAADLVPHPILRLGAAGFAMIEGMSVPARTAAAPSWLSRFWPPVFLLALMWGIRALDSILPGDFNGFGIRSWDPEGLVGVIVAPVLHASWPHLIGNSIPFLVLGLLVAAEGAGRFWAVTGIVALVGGIGTWVINAPGTLTVGASVLVFGYFGYILVRAFFVRGAGHRLLNLLVAVIVVAVYGGAIWSGVFPQSQGISWQAHVCGALGGGIAAFLLRPRRQ